MNKIFFVLPFFFFLIGYYTLSFMVHIQSLETPLLIGMQLKDAVLTLSEQQLNVRILAQKEDPDIPAGTVLSQVPRPGQKIKQQQPVFLVIAKEQEKQKAPDLLERLVDDACSVLKNQSIRVKVFTVPCTHGLGTVVGQWPRPDATLQEPVMILYVADDQQNVFSIFPDLTNEPVDVVQECLKAQGASVDISYASAHDQKHAYSKCKVKSHKPLAGSLVNLSKPLHVRLSIERA